MQAKAVRATGPHPPPLLHNRYLLWGCAVLGAIGGSVAALGQQDLVNLNGWPQLVRFWAAALHPDLSAEMISLTWFATLKTLAYAVCGTCLSLTIGLIGGIFCSEVWWAAVFPAQLGWPAGRSLWLGMRALLAVPRALHELIWGLIFVNLWGLDPLVAVMAIALPFGAITAKVFSEILDETPRQPLLALLNSGVAPLTAFAYGLLPIAGLNLLSYAFYRFECSIRSAAVLGIIGAGGLGYEIFLSLQSLKYEQLWTLFDALVLLNGGVDFASAWLRRRLGCASRLELNLRRTASDRRFRSTALGAAAHLQQPAIWRPELLVLGAIGLGLIPFSFAVVNADFSKLWAPLTWQRLGDIGQASLPPDWQVVPELLPLALQTVAMSILAIAIAAIGGALLAFPAAQTLFLPGGLLNVNRQARLSGAIAGLLLGIARLVLLICRAIPAPIWALVSLFILFPGILPGAIALGLHNLGILGRLQAEVIENLDDRPFAALKAQGAPSSLVFLYGLLPLTAPRFLAYDLYRWEVCMRETVIVGLVGAGGLGRLLTEQLSSFDYQGLVVTLSGFLGLTLAVDWLSAVSRRTLR